MVRLLNFRNWIIGIAFTLAGVFITAEAAAQSAPDPLPQRSSVDARGVDLVSGYVLLAGSADLTIGDPGAGGLSYSRAFFDQGWRGNALGTVSSSGSTYFVSMGSGSDAFTESGGTFTDDDSRGATLISSTDPQGSVTYTYTGTDGTVVIFEKDLTGGSGFPATVNEGVMTKITYPSGEVVKYHYKTYTLAGTPPFSNERLQSITNNFGYQLHFEYEANGSPTTTVGKVQWLQIKKITGINRAIDYCGDLADTCSGFTEAWPTVSYTYATTTTSVSQPSTVTDAEARTTTYTYNGYGRLATIKRPSASSPDVTYNYATGAFGVITSVNLGFGTWTYSFVDASGDRTATITDPLSKTSELVSEIATGLVQSTTDELSRTVSYLYDTSNRPQRVTQPEGNYITYAYDSRGNATTITAVAKSGSGLANIVTSATYPSTCTEIKICNKPTTTTDARGKVTDYIYDTAHGGLLTITATDPDGVGPLVRPEKRFVYSQKQARYKDSASTYVNGTAIYLLMETSRCATLASCDGGSDETITKVTYPGIGSPQNLQLNSFEIAAGDASISSVTAFTYDHVGNIETIDGPFDPQVEEDVTYIHYDLTRRQVGAVRPDPDGAGPLKFRAVRTTYNSDGQLYFTERGTVTSQTSSPWDSTFTTMEKRETFFDAYARPVKAHGYDGATTTILGLTQTSYDNLGRVDCTARRMNQASFSSPESDPCLLGTSGAFGDDRIVKVTYNDASQIIKTTNAYASSVAQDSVTRTFTTNGLPESLTDAAGNISTYEYDGFDRVFKVFFPDPTTAGTSSTTDYNQYTYDADGVLTDFRLRDGTSINYIYDDISRLTLQDAPGANKDHTFTYDNFGRTKTITDGSQTLTYSYDQLSRLKSEAHSVLGTVAYSHDAAGRMTQIDYPGTFNIDYEYNTVGAMTNVKENGSTILATYIYDDLGRRASLTRYNGVTTTYGYDGASRLTSLTHNLFGTTHDQTYTFTHSPAGQINSETSSNSTYDWTAGSDFTDYYTDNGLNQYDTAGGVNVTHEARANTTDIGTEAFDYNSRNQLETANSGDTLSYDPAGRLYEEAATATTRFAYAGAQVISEENASGTVQRRYVKGAGVDETLVWYEGSDTNDRRWLVGDVRGSVVAVTDETGAATDINKYDEYGVPASGNVGRFQYTGQMWLPDQQFYHYKARAYNPETGRFMQPDPIGYGDGMNIYAYVGGDPINARDPSGLLFEDARFSYFDSLSGFGFGGGFSGGFDEIRVKGIRRRKPFIDLGIGQTLRDLVAAQAQNVRIVFRYASEDGGAGGRDDDDEDENSEEEDNCEGGVGTAAAVGAVVGGAAGVAVGTVCLAVTKNPNVAASCAGAVTGVVGYYVTQTGEAVCLAHQENEADRAEMIAKGCVKVVTGYVTLGEELEEYALTEWQCP